MWMILEVPSNTTHSKIRSWGCPQGPCHTEGTQCSAWEIWLGPIQPKLVKCWLLTVCAGTPIGSH